MEIHTSPHTSLWLASMASWGGEGVGNAPSSWTRLPGVPGSASPSCQPSFPSIALLRTTYSSLASMSMLVCEVQVESHGSFQAFPPSFQLPSLTSPRSQQMDDFFL